MFKKIVDTILTKTVHEKIPTDKELDSKIEEFDYIFDYTFSLFLP